MRMQSIPVLVGTWTRACGVSGSRFADVLPVLSRQYVIIPNAVPEENVDALIREIELYLDL